MKKCRFLGIDGGNARFIGGFDWFQVNVWWLGSEIV